MSILVQSGLIIGNAFLDFNLTKHYTKRYIHSLFLYLWVAPIVLYSNPYLIFLSLSLLSELLFELSIDYSQHSIGISIVAHTINMFTHISIMSLSQLQLIVILTLIASLQYFPFIPMILNNIYNFVLLSECVCMYNHEKYQLLLGLILHIYLYIDRLYSLIHGIQKHVYRWDLHLIWLSLLLLTSQ